MINKNQNYYNQERHEMLKYLPKYQLKLIDLGCGSGGFIRSILSHRNEYSDEIWLIEPDTSSFKNTPSVFKKFNSNIESKIGELPDNYFNVIILNDVLEHLLWPEKILEELKSKLSDNGRFVISLPNFNFWLTFKNILKGEFEYEEFGVMDETHFRFFTKKSIIKMCKRRSLRIIEMEGINGLYSVKWRLLNILTFGIFKNLFHQQWAIVIEK